MGFQRVEITSRHVKEALAATGGNDGMDIWADTILRYLQLRRRGGSVKWMVRTKKTLITIGDVRERHPDYLSVKAAREKATTVYSQRRYGRAETPVPADEAPAGWTLGQVCVGYQRFLAHDRWINNRTKPPSEGTNDDVRRAFGQASYQDLGTVPVLQLERV